MCGVKEMSLEDTTNQHGLDVPAFCQNIIDSIIGWKPIETAENFQWVQLYSPDYHKGPGKEKKGVMQGYCRNDGDGKPTRFFDDYHCEVHWNFTHWAPIPDAPSEGK